MATRVGSARVSTVFVRTPVMNKRLRAIAGSGSPMYTFGIRVKRRKKTHKPKDFLFTTNK